MITTQKKIRLKDIAKKSGLAVSTVSMALAGHPNISDDTKNIIKNASETLGYKPLTSAALRYNSAHGNIAKRVGFVIIGGSIDDDAYNGMLYNLSANAFEHGVRIEITAINNPSFSEQDIVEKILDYAKVLDCIMITGCVSLDILKILHNANVQCLVIGDVMGDIFETSIGPRFANMIKFDNILAGYNATRSLIKAGYERIGFISEIFPKGLQHDRWLIGYKSAHACMGITPNLEFIHVAGQAFTGGGPAALKMLKMKNPPNAYVIPDSRTAASFIREMNQSGRNFEKQAVVIGGVIQMAQKFDLQDRPIIANDIEELAKTCVGYLKHLPMNAGLKGIEIIVPHLIKNFSEIPTFEIS